MKNIKIGLIFLFIFSILIGLIFYFQKEYVRIKNNYDVLALNKDNAERLHKNEVKLYYYSIDSLRNALNIRSKTVQTIFKTVVIYRDSVNYKDSTITINVLDTIPYLTTDKLIKRDCYDLYLYQDYETLKYKDTFTGLLHWERAKKFWFIHYGSKQYYLKLYSDCQKDTLKVDKLILIE